MTEEIQEFISYLRDNRKSSANTEISYRRDLRKAAEYFERQDITRVEQITHSHDLQERGVAACFFSVSGKDEED